MLHHTDGRNVRGKVLQSKNSLKGIEILIFLSAKVLPGSILKILVEVKKISS
jgi:hypothetical protein